jgi:hypothetical protein
MAVTLASIGAMNTTYTGVLNIPGSLGAGAYVFHATIVVFNTTTGTATSSGWTVIDQTGGTETAGGSWSVITLYKVVSDASSEPSTYTFTAGGGAADPIGFIRAYSGVDPVTPIPAGGVTKNFKNTGGSGLTVSGATVARDDSLGVFGLGGWYFDTAGNLTATGWTKNLTGAEPNTEASGFTTTAVQNIGTSISASITGTTDNQSFGAILNIFQPTSASDFISIPTYSSYIIA